MDNLPTLQFNSLDIFKSAAKFAVESKLFGIKDESQALALMLLCQAEGIHPMSAVRDYHVIQGKATLKAESMLAKFQAVGGSIRWMQLSESQAEAVFSHPQGGEVTIKWDIEMAKKAGLTGKDVWRAYPRAMLRSRVVSEGIRTVYPGCLSGAHTPEEAEDFIDVTPAEKPTKKTLAKLAEAHKIEAEKAEPVSTPPAEIVEETTGEVFESPDIVLLRDELTAEINRANDVDRPSTIKSYKEAQKAYGFKLVEDIKDGEILRNLKIVFGRIGNDQTL